MQWLFDVPLRGAILPFDVSAAKSAVIEGNEDCPSRVMVFEKRMPLISDAPLATYVIDGDGNLYLQP